MINATLQPVSLELAILVNANFTNAIFGEASLFQIKLKGAILEGVKKAFATNSSISIEQEMAFKLKSLGLVNLEGNEVTVSCGLYRKYFRYYFGFSPS